jgi:hypothetical protein
MLPDLTTDVQTTAAAEAAAPWADRAEELAAWAWQRLVNRVDVWGGYHAIADRNKVIKRHDGTTGPLGTTTTKPRRKDRGLVVLKPQVLVWHFFATEPTAVVGLHTTSPENTSKWGGVEVDWHGEGSTDPAVNWHVTRTWYDRLVTRGFRPLLTDSNGAGGYHLDVLLAEPVDTPRVFYFLRDLVKDHAALGLPNRPETFPKQPKLIPRGDGRGKYGNWLRVPGRHHTRAHWSRVWSGGEWLDGAGAVDFILGLKGDPPSLIPEDMEWQSRIGAYLAKLPNLGEGQGRDDVAYNFLAFMVRDLMVPDDYALEWANCWDANNHPPKGPERLRQILASAHEYGQRGYGSGREPNANGHAQPPASAAGPPAVPAGDQQQDKAMRFFHEQGIDIDRVIKLGKVRGAVDLILHDGTRIELGRTADLLSPRKVKEAIFDHVHVAIATPRQNDWDPIAQALLRMATVEETGTAAEELEDWVKRFLNAHKPWHGNHRAVTEHGYDIVDALKKDRPWLAEDGTVYLTLAMLRQFLADREHARPTQTELCQRLRRGGWIQSTPEVQKEGKVKKRRCWKSPPAWLPKDEWPEEPPAPHTPTT